MIMATILPETKLDPNDRIEVLLVTKVDSRIERQSVDALLDFVAHEVVHASVLIRHRIGEHLPTSSNQTLESNGYTGRRAPGRCVEHMGRDRAPHSGSIYCSARRLVRSLTMWENDLLRNSSIVRPVSAASSMEMAPELTARRK